MAKLGSLLTELLHVKNLAVIHDFDVNEINGVSESTFICARSSACNNVVLIAVLAARGTIALTPSHVNGGHLISEESWSICGTPLAASIAPSTASSPRPFPGPFNDPASGDLLKVLSASQESPRESAWRRADRAT